MRTLTLLFFLNLQVAHAQYWQQRVDYRIACILDDKLHHLSANERIKYHNHSPDTLSVLKIHVWMNAFGPRPSDYSAQMARLGDYKKHNLSSKNEGGYRTLEFKVEDQSLTYTFDDKTHEILTLILAKPLLPGATTDIDIQFELDLPKNISRGGHLGESYQMTQWYPKVALYDSAGWHTMPYLEFGEFYNDFGDYDVTITLPDNYIVAATGTLDTEHEKTKLQAYADSCLSKSAFDSSGYHLLTPSSSLLHKTIHFSATNVIDFAWFADKRFKVAHRIVTIEKKSVDLWTYFLPRQLSSWTRAIDHAEHAIEYYNQLVGPYPYPQASLVEGDREGTDAMEYPMIALIDKGYRDPIELEKVIVHEIGHNWFQAVLASDERTQPWMDEGMVTYYEHRYFRNKISTGFLTGGGFFTLNTDYEPVQDYLWHLQAGQNSDASASEPATEYTVKGYVQSIYEKPAKGILMVEKTLGQSQFDALMQQYYKTWSFKHPQSRDLLDLFKSNQISWVDSLYLLSNIKPDVKINATSNPHIFTIHKDVDVSISVEIAGYHRSVKIFSTIRQLHGSDSLFINNDSIQYLVLDPDFVLPEFNRHNNIIRIASTPFAPKKNQFHLLAGIGHSMVRDYYGTPALGFNFYDGWMAGAVFHNLTLPISPFRFAGMLGYGFKSKKPVILAYMEYARSMKSSVFRQIIFDAEIKNFTFYRDTHYQFQNRYFKIAPRVKLILNPSAQNATITEWSYRPIFIHQSYGVGTNFKDYTFDLKSKSHLIHELKWHIFQHQSINAFDVEIVAEKSKGYGKLYIQSSIQSPYRFASKKYGEWRFFGGLQSSASNNNLASSFLLSGLPGIRQFQRDYKLDELFLGRSEESNSLSQQIFVKDAGFNTVSNVIASDSWMVAASYRAMLPGFIPLRPYVQAALSPSTNQKIQLSYSSGFSLVVLKDVLEINFPAWESKNITESTVYQIRNNYIKKCTFLLNLKGLSPFKWIRSVSE